MKIKYIIILLFCTFSQVFGQKGKPFVLVNVKQQADIVIAKTEAECVQLAVADLVADIQKISGKALNITEQAKAKSSKIFIKTEKSQSWESYQIKTKNGDLHITGSDERGTMFGIYHFIEHYLGVDPMYFWNDVEPKKLAVLSWENIDYQSSKPTFKYRGWFINDEDLLTEWYETTGKRHIDYPFYQQVVSPEIMKKVCETAVRMRFNLIIPASFIDIRNPDETALVNEAAKRGLFLSMHHVEPMGVSAFTYFNYWKAKDCNKPLFSYFSNREKVEEVWRVYAKEWSKYPNVIWQIGLRGIGDRPMWLADPNTPQTDADRGKLISDAMAFQMQLIKEVDKRPTPSVTTTLWAEGSNLNQAGFLNIPENVMVIFADNSPGWRWQTDFFQTKRQPKNSYGVYYHHQLWGSGPHLVPIVSPAKTQSVLAQAVEKGDTAYCIMNVSNIREYPLGIAASAQMLWDFKDFNTEKFNNQWFSKHYGKQSKAVQQVYQTYFDSFQLNDKSGTPILMDGQCNSLATEVLNELKLQLTDPPQYQALLQKKKQETEESKWIKNSIGDMLSGGLSHKDLLLRVIKQKEGFEKAEVLAQIVLPKLNTEQNAFFQTNFMAHLKIMMGLNAWLENSLQVKIAADDNNLSLCKKYIQHAFEAFTMIKAGQSIKSDGEKWKNWYLGDKKMNLKRKEALTKEILEYLISGIGVINDFERLNSKSNNKINQLKATKNLVALWDFKEPEGQARKAIGQGEFALKEQNGALPRISDGPLSGYSTQFGNKAFLSLSHSEVGKLNIYGKKQGVTVIAWVKWTGEQTGFVGGMWNEYQDGGKRQYGLFVSLPHYNGRNQVCGHISQTGKPTPPFPYSCDYSASKQEVPANQWVCVAFTYDGKDIKSYLNGVFEKREPELINNTKGFEGYPDGLVQSKNPYHFPYGMGNNGSDFTVGAVLLKSGMGNFFKGQIGGLAVFDRALSEKELKRLAE